MMISRTFTVLNPHGFHVRPTRTFVEKAMAYPCEVFVIAKGKRMNGKSLLGMMTLGLKNQDEVTLEIEGESEQEAMEELGQLLTAIYD